MLAAKATLIGLDDQSKVSRKQSVAFDLCALHVCYDHLVVPFRGPHLLSTCPYHCSAIGLCDAFDQDLSHPPRPVFDGH